MTKDGDWAIFERVFALFPRLKSKLGWEYLSSFVTWMRPQIHLTEPQLLRR